MHTPPEKVVIGLLSRIDTGKGVGIFADAFEYLQQEVQQKIEFWIMGEPTVKSVNAKGEPTYEEQALKLLDKLKALSKKHPTSFKLIPFQTEYIAWLQAMDIFVLPTINEMYSLAVVDAMMTGLPVIGTNAGGTSEQIGRNERGLLVEPGSAKAIADAIAEMIKNPEEMKQKGEAARNWATTQHNFQTTVSQILDVCNEKLPLRNEELPVNLPH
jgi:Glycosyltransferase